MSIQTHSELNIKKINYGKPEKQGLVYYSPINYNNEPFYLQTPKMKCKQLGEEIISKKNNTMDIEILNNDFSFYEFLLNLDEKNVKDTFKNNKEWFNKDIPLEIIDDMYKRTCKPIKKETKPSFSFKVPVIKGKIQCQVYDQKKTFIDIHKLEPDSEVICILHIKGLKFLKQHYYCDCYVSQIKVFLDKDNKYSILESYAFDDKEEQQTELDELNREMILDEYILKNMRSENDEQKQKEKKELTEKIDAANKIIEEHTQMIDSLQNQLSLLN